MTIHEETMYIRIKGDNGVKIINEEYGAYLSTTTNGRQWISVPLTTELIYLLADAFSVNPEYYIGKMEEDQNDR